MKITYEEPFRAFRFLVEVENSGVVVAAFSQFSGNTIRPHARFYTRQRLAARANGVGVRRQLGNIHGLSARRAIDDVFLLGNHERRATERESEKRKEEKRRCLSVPPPNMSREGPQPGPLPQI